MWRYSIAVVALACMLLPAVARAQFKGGDWVTEIAGSGVNDKDFRSGQASLDTTLGYMYNEQIELGLRNSLVWADGGSAHSATPRVFGDYHFDMGRCLPFVGANIGYQCSDLGSRTTGLPARKFGVKYFVNQTTFIQLLCSYEFNLNRGFRSRRVLLRPGYRFPLVRLAGPHPALNGCLRLGFGSADGFPIPGPFFFAPSPMC